MQGKSQLGKAVGDWSACLRLSGYAREYIPNSLAGNAILTINKCLGKGPHNLRDTWSHGRRLDQRIRSPAGDACTFLKV